MGELSWGKFHNYSAERFAVIGLAAKYLVTVTWFWWFHGDIFVWIRCILPAEIILEIFISTTEYACTNVNMMNP